MQPIGITGNIILTNCNQFDEEKVNNIQSRHVNNQVIIQMN